MRLFQNSGLMASYAHQLHMRTRTVRTFEAKLGIFLDDRFGAPHFLKPVLDRDRRAFFTNGSDEDLQRAWAREQGLNSKASLDDILLAQIEAHRTEVFYNLDPVRFGDKFVARLPGSVRSKIAWRAAPGQGASLSGYDLIVCNFPSILQAYQKDGLPSRYFTPGHDPEMDAFAERRERPIDILFVGGYSRHHAVRAALLETVARLRNEFNVVYHLDVSRMTRLAETPLGIIGPLQRLRRAPEIRSVARVPVFGRALYSALSSSKIVVNGAVDMAGQDRGNMRCFEAMGCGALLLTDEGVYPQGMVPHETLVTYNSAQSAVSIIRQFLGDPERARAIARKGYEMVREYYSKQRQWERFCALAG